MSEEKIDEVEAQDQSLENSPISEEAPKEDAPGYAANPCMWNGKEYSHGAVVTDGGRRYRCYNGQWLRTMG